MKSRQHGPGAEVAGHARQEAQHAEAADAVGGDVGPDGGHALDDLSLARAALWGL